MLETQGDLHPSFDLRQQVCGFGTACTKSDPFNNILQTDLCAANIIVSAFVFPPSVYLVWTKAILSAQSHHLLSSEAVRKDSLILTLRLRAGLYLEHHFHDGDSAAPQEVV